MKLSQWSVVLRRFEIGGCFGTESIPTNTVILLQRGRIEFFNWIIGSSEWNTRSSFGGGWLLVKERISSPFPEIILMVRNFEYDRFHIFSF